MTPEYLVIHTAAYDGEHDDLEDIIRWHKERGFRTIGYHYYIRKDGTIRKGRKDDEVGAHCKASSMNHKSLGICFEGHHDKESWTPRQRQAFSVLCQILVSKYDIPQENVIGHREAYTMHGRESPKTCPGTKIDMDHVRKRYAYNPVRKVSPAKLDLFKAGKINFNKDIKRL